MNEWFYYNDHIYQQAPKINLLNRSFLLGESFFVSFSVKSGVFLLFEENIRRLIDACANLLGQDTNFAAKIRHDFLRFSQEISPLKLNGYCRMTCFRTGDLTNIGELKYFFYFKPGTVDGLISEKPQKLASRNFQYSWSKLPCKMGSYGSLFLDREQSNMDDILLIDDQRNILECTSSNIVFVDSQSGLHCPEKSLPYYQGVGLDILESFCRVSDISFRFSKIKLDDLKDYSYCFSCNQIKGLRAIGQIDEYKISFIDHLNEFDQLKRDYTKYVLEHPSNLVMN